MKLLTSKSYAKINLCLHVISKRNDGYHNIQSIFRMINLYDILTFEKNNLKEINLQTNSNEIIKEDNLITQAYMLMLDKFHLKSGLNVTLEKNIPIGSGLGGGSSNAAVTLLAIKKLFELEISDCEILSLAEALGSDVPFFINGGAAKVAGRGEVIEPITPGKKYFILIFSNIEIETRGIYESLSENALCDELHDSALLDSQENSLESVVMKKYPELMQTKYWLSSFGKVRMSGTGSTLYIEFDSYESAHEVNMEIAQKYKSKIVSSLDSYEIFS